ncbi:hypothetical protein ACWCV9_14270 [Streptomyces sp. NPDC001606]
MRDEDIVAAVRAMRVESPDLWTGDASTWVTAVDALLRRAEVGERVSDEILALLTSDAAIREDLGRRLSWEEDTYRGPEAGSGFAPLAGYGDPSTEVVYGCAVCDYTYPIFEAGESVPEGCPSGHVPLLRIT